MATHRQSLRQSARRTCWAVCTALALMCLEAQRCQTNGDTSPTEMKIFNQQKQGYLPNGNEDITITIWR